MNARLVIPGVILCAPFLFLIGAWTVRLFIHAIRDRQWGALAMMISGLLAGLGVSLLLRALEGAP